MGNPQAWLWMILIPALLLAVLAQLVMQVVFARASGAKTKMSGYAVARHVLDGSGLYDIQVEQVPGALSDHFDSQRRVLQLSPEVYHGRHVAAMAIAAHEACHALQQQQGSAWFFLRGLAIPAATFGSGGGILIALVGLLSRFPPLLALGILLFSVSLYLQLLSLPVEIGASLLARRRLATLGIADEGQRAGLAGSLAAVAITYVGATLQSVFTLMQRIVARAGQGKDV